MPFERNNLALANDTIGGGSLRIHFYTSPDGESDVSGSGYFTRVGRMGVREGDLVVVAFISGDQLGGTIIAEVTEVDAFGNATITIKRNFSLDFESVAAAEGEFILSTIKSITTQFYAPDYLDRDTLVGGATYIRILRSELDTLTGDGLPDTAWFRSQDRFTPTGGLSSLQGGYWINADQFPNAAQFGGSTEDLIDYVKRALPTAGHHVFPVPIRAGVGIGQAPVDLIDRYENLATSTDYELVAGDDADAATTNATNLAKAVTDLAPMNGVLLMLGKDEGRYVTDTLDVHGGHPGKGVMHIVGDRAFNRNWGAAGDYATGLTLKLKDGASAGNCLIKVPAGSATFVLQNILLDANGPGQSGTRHGLYFENAGSSADGANIDNVAIINANGNGLYCGANRGRSHVNNLWVLYCGSSVYPAINQSTYDWTYDFLNVTNPLGTAMYIGGSQIQIATGGCFYSKRGIDISSDAGDVTIAAFSFDRMDEWALQVVGYAGPGANYRPGRQIIGCRFISNSKSAHNTYSDIRSSDPYLMLLAPSFGGFGDSGTAVLPKYHIEFVNDGRAFVIAPNWESGVTCGTALTNNADRAIMGGSVEAGVYETLTMKIANIIKARQNLQIGEAVTAAARYIDAVALPGYERGIRMFSGVAGNPVLRFSGGLDTAAEAGSNAGSDYIEQVFADNGSAIGTSRKVRRKYGLNEFPLGIRVRNVHLADLTNADNLPANIGAGCLVYVDDATGGPVLAVSTGSEWRRVSDDTVVN